MGVCEQGSWGLAICGWGICGFCSIVIVAEWLELIFLGSGVPKMSLVDIRSFGQHRMTNKRMRSTAIQIKSSMVMLLGKELVESKMQSVSTGCFSLTRLCVLFTSLVGILCYLLDSIQPSFLSLLKLTLNLGQIPCAMFRSKLSTDFQLICIDEDDISVEQDVSSW